jgi:hypothetical protein
MWEELIEPLLANEQTLRAIFRGGHGRLVVRGGC